jgi:phage head maturation protease
MNAVADTGLNHAYSFIRVKTLDEETRTFSGVASTPELDRQNDTINPLAATFTNPVVLLHAHRHDAPIGTATLHPPTSKGIRFSASIAVVKEPGLLRDRTQLAWDEIRHGLVKAVSIGFRPTGPVGRNAHGGVDFRGIEILELSTVSCPANASATIEVVKRFDAEARAAAFQAPAVRRPIAPLTALATLEARRVQVWTQIDAAKAAGNSDWGRLAEIDRALEAEITVEKVRASNRSLGVDENYGLHPPPDLARAIESRLDRLETAAAERINDALAAMDVVWSRKFAEFQKVAATSTAAVMREVLDAVPKQHSMHFAGTHQRALAYGQGAVVNDQSSLWVATRAVAAGERPGDGDAWQLVLKSPQRP